MWVLAVLSSSAMVFYLGVGGIDTNRYACFDPSQGDSRWQRVLRDWLAEGEGRDPDDWTMAAAAGEFVLGRAVAGASAECVKREAYHLKIWLAWSVAAGAGLAREIDEDLVLRFLTCRRDEFGNRGGTLKRYEDTLSSLTRFLHRKGALRSDPLADLGFRSPRDRRLERVLSIEELDSLGSPPWPMLPSGATDLCPRAAAVRTWCSARCLSPPAFVPANSLGCAAATSTRQAGR